ncbi:organic cation transporter protein-like [Octopus vulgaris]|uniref:Organic cation transporter protein-like n=1 Tax=Octopus vulgaris TaxID=6645 RepID=A0AA36FAF6_OCTVU|nr:organic cation transporter protein-like [Octopus vulgaris]
MAENEEHQLESNTQTATRISDKDITQLIENCGSFGLYHRWLYIFIFVICMLSALQFDLVCERKWLKSTLQSVHFAGYLVGSIVFGILCDRFGRRPILLLASACLVVCGITKTFIPSLTIIFILQLIQASGHMGVAISTFVLILELTSVKQRTPVSFFYGGIYASGGLIVTGLAYAISDWHYLELIVCILPILNFFVWMFLPESPRWLIERKRLTEAKALFRKIMKKNKKENLEMLDIFTNNAEETSFKNSFQEDISEGKDLPKVKNYTFIDLFKTWRIALITLNICFSWFVTSMLYYGESLESLQLLLQTISYQQKYSRQLFEQMGWFGLVCENKWLISTLQSVYFAGHLVGSIVFGALADSHGIYFFRTTFVPESPRWFIGRKRFREAEAILEEVIKKNKKQHEDELGILTDDEEETLFENSFQENIPEKTIVNKEENYTFIDLFKTWRIALITLNICFGWMACSMLFYGVILKSVDMAGNRYLNYLLMQIVEFPSNYVSYYFFIRFDHRKPISFFMVFSGLNCIVSNFVTEGSFWIPLILVVLGKSGISAAFSSIYLLSAEIFPTVVRTNGLGVASMTSRIGSMLAPFILHLSYYVKWLPLSIFGVLSFISGMMILLLPETKDKDLPQTLDDLTNRKNF